MYVWCATPRTAGNGYVLGIPSSGKPASIASRNPRDRRDRERLMLLLPEMRTADHPVLRLNSKRLDAGVVREGPVVDGVRGDGARRYRRCRRATCAWLAVR